MQLYKYKIFGLNTLSELDLGLEQAIFENEDITLKIGTVEFEAHNPDEPGFKIQLRQKFARFSCRDIARYQVEEGTRIIIDADVNSEKETIKLFLLGSAFGFLMHQRNEFPLHGSTVVIGNACITLVGHSGAGKSSLASGFIQKGYKLLTDDVSRMTFEEDQIIAHHSYPSQKIWKDAANHLAIEYDSTRRVLTSMDKYFITNLERFEMESKPLKAVVEIFPGPVQTPYIERLGNQVALNTLLTHSYRQEFMGPYMDLGAHLKYCAELLKTVPVYRLYRPLEEFTVSEQVEVLLREFG